MPKLAIITTHPIQYYAPLFKLLNYRGQIDIKVFYTWSQANEVKHDPDFNKAISWDIPLLIGYNYDFINNVSKSPGSRSFKGIDNPTLVQEIEKWGANAILVFGWAFKSHLKALRYFKGKIPVYFRGDSNLLDEVPGFSLKKTLRRAFLSWVYKYIDKAFYVGQANKDYYLKYGVQEHKLVYSPHAIDNNRFATSYSEEILKQKVQWRLNKGIQEDEIVFLFVGKFLPKKDPLTLLEAFIAANLKKCWLLLVGGGELETQLREKASNNQHILFEAFQNQSKMPLMYSIGDVFVLPSIGPGETWGLAVNEAMAGAKPVIVSNKCGCAADLVEEGKNGFVVKAGSFEALIKTLKYFDQNRDQLGEMGKASLKIVEQYNFERICIAIEEEVGKIN